MANRYWVGGAADWDNVAGTKWALTSGGVGGQAVPTGSDDVFFDAASGSVAVTMTNNTGTRACNNLTFTGFTGTFSGTRNITIAGNLLLISGITFSSTGAHTFNSTATGKTITVAGKTLGSVVFNGVGGEWTLQDAFTVTTQIQLTNGSLNTNNVTVTARNFESSNSNTRTLTLGSSTLVLSGDSGSVNPWNFVTTTGLIFSSGTSTIKLVGVSGSGMNFGLANLTYYNIWFDRGSDTSSRIISSAGTCNDFRDTGTSARSIIFSAGITITVTTFTVSGTPGNLVTINSLTTATHALVKTGGGTIACDYLNIQHSVATPASTWYAGTHSTNNQGVVTAGSGWIFTDPPAPSSRRVFMIS